VTRVAINGFGRIGRAMFRILAQQPGHGVELVAINDNAKPDTAAHLIRHDTTHGPFSADIRGGDGEIVMGDRRFPLTNLSDPGDYDWRSYGADVVLECTGRYTERSRAELHLGAGAKKVLISAPGKGADITVVLGVNDDSLEGGHRIVSLGSCTTNCLAPMAKVINDSFGVECGWMSTVHSFTNDQRLLDGRHDDLRRARSALGSIIPTKTGAAKALGLVLPELEGKLSGVSLRVPTPNVSLVDLTVLLGGHAAAEDISAEFEKAAAGPMAGVLACNREPLVSSDFLGHPASCIYDAGMTMVAGGRLAKVFGWYDNEWAFAHRMLDVADLMGAS